MNNSRIELRCQHQFLSIERCTTRNSAIPFWKNYAPSIILESFANDFIAMSRLRQYLAREPGFYNLALFNDHEVLDLIANLISSGAYKLELANRAPSSAFGASQMRQGHQKSTGDESSPKLNNKRCRIEFEASHRDIKNGIFGFDWFRDKYRKRKVAKNSTALEKEYTPCEDPSPLSVAGEEYFVSWLSIRNGQTVTLKVNRSIKGAFSTVMIEPNKNFKFVPEDLMSAESIAITCQADLSQPLQLRVTADGEPAGALNITQNQIRRVEVRWVFVNLRSKAEDHAILAKKIKRLRLEEGFRAAFNPAIIDASLVNSEPFPLDLTSALSKRDDIRRTADNGITYINYEDRGTFAEFIAAQDTSQSPTAVNLYFSNIKLLAGEQRDDNSESVIGGLSPIGSNRAYLFLDPNAEFQNENIAHELMHALGLPHAFPEEDAKTKQPKNQGKKHMFGLGMTDNYMDYNNSKNHTWRWQWQILRESPLVS